MNSAANLALIAMCAIGAGSLHAVQNRPTETSAGQNSRAKDQQGHGREYDPVRATHDVEVGKFYMKRGDLAGAIARFKDAILYKPHYAEARLLLGEAYEKNHDPRRAIIYYKQYLEILPSTPESKKVRERIAALQDKLAKQETASSKDR